MKFILFSTWRPPNCNRSSASLTGRISEEATVNRNVTNCADVYVESDVEVMTGVTDDVILLRSSSQDKDKLEYLVVMGPYIGITTQYYKRRGMFRLLYQMSKVPLSRIHVNTRNHMTYLLESG